MDPNNIKFKDVFPGLLAVVWLIIGLYLLESNLVLGILTLSPIIIFIFYTIYSIPRETLEKIHENEQKSPSRKLLFIFKTFYLVLSLLVLIWYFIK